MAGLDLDFDPFQGHDPLASIGKISGLSQGHGPRVARASFRMPLPLDQSESFGKQVLDSGASGLSYILGTLDKPGQAIRGMLAGHGVAALKHLVPFSDSMGLTTDADHASGRDLTDQYGITDKRDKGWGAWGTGLAADIATDPLSYLSFGAKHALTPIGKAVQKTGAFKGWSGRAMLEGFHGVEPAMLQAGQTASDITHAIDKGRRIAQGTAAATGVEANRPLSSLVRIGLPFGGPGVNVGTGKTAQKMAGALDAAGDWMKYKLPGAKAVSSLFDHAAHGAVDEITQRGSRRYLDPALTELQRLARDDRFGVIRELDPLVSKGTHPETMINDAARAVAEGVPHRFDPSLVAQVQDVANHTGGVNSRYLAEARAAGAPIKDVADKYADYVHRSAFPENPNSLGLGGRRGQGILPTTSAANIGRDEVFRDIPGGTNRINDWFDRFAGLAKQRPTVARAVKKDLVQDFQRTGGRMSPALGKEFDAKAAALAERLEHASEAYRSTPDVAGKPFFSPDLTADMTQRGQQHARTVASAKAAIGILGDVARPWKNDGSMVRLSEAMKQLGLKTYKADAQAGTPMKGALVQMYRGLAKQGAGKVDPFLMGKIEGVAAAGGPVRDHHRASRPVDQGAREVVGSRGDQVHPGRN